MKIRFSISLDEEIIKKLDKKRGDVPRSTYLNKLLEKYLKGGKKKMNKKLILPILMAIFLVGGVLALFIFANLKFTFGVDESATTKYYSTIQGTNCSTVNIFSYSTVPSNSVYFNNVNPADKKRVCFKIENFGENPVNIVLSTLGTDWNSSLIKSYSITNPSPVSLFNSPKYGWVDYNIAGDANPSATFNGTISVGRE